MHESLRLESSRDMQLLHEIAQTPHVTQRDLAKRIGIALGLTNLTLHRLADKGYIQVVVNAKKSRSGYLITPSGIAEKARLTCEFVHSFLPFYGKIRELFHKELSSMRDSSNGRVVLCGTDELAEIACLTIQEMGLRVVGAVSLHPQEREHFLSHPVKSPSELKGNEYDWVVVVSPKDHAEIFQGLVEAGIPRDRILGFSFQGGDPQARSKAARSSKGPSTALVPLRSSTTDVVILCGGKGSRLGSLTATTPKPLLPVGGYPFLLRLLLHLKQQGFTRFILAAHYLSDQFESFLSNYSHLIPNIQLVIEPEPLGTGGALRHAVESVRSATFVVLNGDTWGSQSLASVLADHQQARRIFTVVAVPASHVEGGAFHKGVWRIDPQGRVEDFATEENVLEGWVNAGTYVLDRATVRSWPQGRYSLEENLPALLSGKEAGVFCSSGRLLDIGTTQTYEQADRILQPLDSLVAAGGV